MRGVLTVCVLACLTAACGCTEGQPEKVVPVPAHRVCDIDESSNGRSVSVFAVVDLNLSVADAWAIFHDYEKRYPRATIALNVDLFCDDTYAHHRFLTDRTVSDRQYYAHVLYSFMKNVNGVQLGTRENPASAGQGSACR
jgi:hypothetical protein